MNNYRFNIIDADGIVSFLGPRHGSKMIAAACSANHRTLRGVLTYVRALDEAWVQDIESGLNAFDQDAVSISAPQQSSPALERVWQHPFRVVDAMSRQASMIPGALGLLVINLKEQRIIQVENRSVDLQRKDRGRVRRHGKPTRMLFRYHLSPEWALVP